MARGYKPVKSSNDKSNLFAAGSNDPVLKRYLGERLLARLGGKKPAPPKSNVQLAKEYYLAQQKAKGRK